MVREADAGNKLKAINKCDTQQPTESGKWKESRNVDCERRKRFLRERNEISMVGLSEKNR